MTVNGNLRQMGNSRVGIDFSSAKSLDLFVGLRENPGKHPKVWGTARTSLPRYRITAQPNGAKVIKSIPPPLFSPIGTSSFVSLSFYAIGVLH